MIIPIKCKGNRYLPHGSIKPFQGNLKELSVDNAEKLKKQIISLGWSFPVFVWENEGENYTIDGHGRLLVLPELLKEGYTIGDLPVVDILAESVGEAKQKLLACNSHYQRITQDGLYEFMEGGGLELQGLIDLELPDIDLEEFVKGYYGDESGEEESSDKKTITCPKCGHEW